MSKQIKLLLPEDKNPQKEKIIKENIIKELQHNIDMKLEILQDRLKAEQLICVEEVDIILEDTKSIIDECYSTPNFNTNFYRNFSILIIEYQRLSLRKEAANVEYEISELKKNTELARTRNEEIENSLKNWLGTIIGLFLTFTIIPTAITGITTINENYILPFVATLVLFGMIMIAYTYAINHIKISKGACIILVAMAVTMISLWYGVCFSNIDISSHNSDIEITSSEFNN